MSNWAPHPFATTAKQRGLSPDFVQRLVDEGNRLDSLNLPVVFTLGHLSALCDVPYKYLRDIVSRRFDPYRVFNVRKRSGGYRQITVPETMLMRVQRWIHTNILKNAYLNPIATAYRPGAGPFLNATKHAGSNWLVKVDVKSFFESISERQVYHAFRDLGYPALLSFEFTRLCTRFSDGENKYTTRRWRGNRKDYVISSYSTRYVGHLPQGAPTSPMLANLVCLRLDAELARTATKYGGVITRYADDIVFSSGDCNRGGIVRLIREVTDLLSENGFKRNHSKTAIVPKSARQIVTGLVVNSGKPTLARKFRDRLRMHLYHAKTKGVASHCTRRGFKSLIGFQEHVRGLIAYARQIDPEFAAKCESDFKQIKWFTLEMNS